CEARAHRRARCRDCRAGLSRALFRDRATLSLSYPMPPRAARPGARPGVAHHAYTRCQHHARRGAIPCRPARLHHLPFQRVPSEIPAEDARQARCAPHRGGDSHRGTCTLIPAQPGALDGRIPQAGRRRQMASARRENRAGGQGSRCLRSGRPAGRSVPRSRRLLMGQATRVPATSPAEGSPDGFVLSGKAAAAAERLYTRNEHRVDLAIHILGMLFAVNASLWLLWRVTGLRAAVSVSVYCAGLLAMIVLSATYNLWPVRRSSKQWLRRLDHSAIFIMIAATYTPFAA